MLRPSSASCSGGSAGYTSVSDLGGLPCTPAAGQVPLRGARGNTAATSAGSSAVPWRSSQSARRWSRPAGAGPRRRLAGRSPPRGSACRRRASWPALRESRDLRFDQVELIRKLRHPLLDDDPPLFQLLQPGRRVGYAEQAP
mgnify:CR=1 FL=1